MKKIISMLLLVFLLLLGTSCGSDEEPSVPYVQPLGIVNYTKAEELVSEGDFDNMDSFKTSYTDKSYVISQTFDISEKNVYIRMPGIYKITGVTDANYIDILLPSEDDPYDVTIILDGVSINGDKFTHSFPAIYSVGCDLTVVLPENSENKLSSNKNNLENGVITVKKGSLTLEGSGKLSISTTDTAINGIHCTKQATVKSGVYDINVGNHGIYGKEGLSIDGGEFNVTSGRFGLKSGDSPSETNPANVVGNMVINGGIFNIVSTENGIDVNGTLTIQNAGIRVSSKRNAIKSNDSITVGKEGKKTLLVLTSDTDGLDSDNDITIFGDTDIKINSVSDAIVGRNVTVNSSGLIYVTTKGEYTQSSTGDYILLSDGRYIKINPLNYPNETFYDILISCKGIKALENITVNNGKIVISSMEDGIHGNNVSINGGVIDIVTDEDGIHALNNASIGGGTINIHKSYKGIKALNTVVSAGKTAVASFSDGIDSPSVTVTGGELFLLDKIDVGTDGSFKVTGGTVIIIASSTNPCVPTSTTVSCVKSSVSKPELAKHTSFVRVSGGNIDITFKLPKGYTEKIAVSVISDKLVEGEYNAQIGTTTAFKGVYTNGITLTDAFTQRLVR